MNVSIESTDEKNVSIESEFSCASCLHSRAQLSIGAASVDLMCAISGEAASDLCEDFTYEPGTDEHEKIE